MLGIIAIALLIAAPASATYMELAIDASWTFAYTGPGTFTLNPFANSASISSYAQYPVEFINNSNTTLGGSFGVGQQRN